MRAEAELAAYAGIAVVAFNCLIFLAEEHQIPSMFKFLNFPKILSGRCKILKPSVCTKPTGCVNASYSDGSFWTLLTSFICGRKIMATRNLEADATRNMKI